MSALDEFVLTTELDAVNLMLFAIGEQPVSTLETSGLVDVALAKTTLADVNRRVQSKGWDFNRDLNFSLALATDGTIPVPANALRVEPVSKDYVQRAGKLWDRPKNTFVVSAAAAVKCDIIRYFPFTDIPQAARDYIALKAARRFIKHMLGDVEVEGFGADDENEALLNMTDADSETANRNLMNDAELGGNLRVGRDLRRAIDN